MHPGPNQNVKDKYIKNETTKEKRDDTRQIVIETKSLKRNLLRQHLHNRSWLVHVSGATRGCFQIDTPTKMGQGRLP